MPDSKPIKVMLIEDDTEDYIITKELLAEGMGRRALLDWCSTPEEGLKALCEGKHDIYLLDYRLGQSTGLDLLKDAAAQKCARQPVILLTGEKNRELDIEAMREGASDYLIKGQITPTVLERAIRYSIEQHKAMNSLKESHDLLERRVEERTAEIQKAHDDLQGLHSTNTHILESITDAFFALDDSSCFAYVNAQAESLLGKTREELIGSYLWDQFPQEVGSPFYSKYHQAAETLSSVEFEEFYSNTGQWLYVRIYPSAEGLSVFLADITEKKRMEEEAHYQSLHDTLTDLPNRNLFEGRLTQAIASAKRTKEKLAVLFLDVDRFNIVNDSLGHEQGDAIIRQISERLKSGFEQEEDIVARFGADEFLVMLNGISIGVSCFPDDGEEVSALIKNADAALYRAKETGRGTYHFYNDAIHSQSWQDLQLENDLQKAIERNELIVYYQPIIDVTTGKVTKSEALIRWNHPRLGIIFPNDFIPLAEKSGMIVALGEWMLASVCEQIIAWKEKGFGAISVAVNISPRQFYKTGFCRGLKAMLKEKKISPDLLQLEITETLAMENSDTTVEKLKALKKVGIQVALDDFGTGYSSLSYLKQLHIDRLKIDKSFISACTEDDRDAAIVKAIVSMGHTLGLSVCAEGVETLKQLKYLASLECEHAQGFFFSKSLPAPEFEKWVKGYEADSVLA
ncbi:MAG: hypothetical protein K0S20_416 [Patescibacteria group bacterium]|nr:hypothetical protein [Patescibacteria group bacterium]